MTFIRTVALVLLLIIPVAAVAQEDDEQAVRAHVEALFDAMRASDAEAVAAHFHSEPASLYSVGRTAEGDVRVQVADLEQFAASVGNAPAGLLDEHLGPIEVRVDGDLATAYMPYAFYLGERFSHCGVNAFHLVRTADGWRTIHITDTRRKTDCHPSIAPESVEP
jgi:ketosteroid isomerase-like protein